MKRFRHACSLTFLFIQPLICFAEDGNTLAESVLYKTGGADGTFAAEQQFFIGGTQPRDFCLDDFDGDGDEDLAVVNFDSGDFAVMLNVCPLLGDVNLDGMVDLRDVPAFVDLLANNPLYQEEADINQDGAVDLLDVALFVNLLMN